MIDIIAKPFDWNDNLSEEAIEDFETIRGKLTYCQHQSIGMALAKLELLEKQGCKVGLGQWIEHVERDDWDDSEEVWYECDQCHVGSERVSNYCPTCGAKMSEGSGEE